MKIKIIIPIYNDWQSAFKLFEEIDNLKIDKNFEISIIVVNDASNHDRSNEEVIFENIQSIVDRISKQKDVKIDIDFIKPLLNFYIF